MFTMIRKQAKKLALLAAMLAAAPIYAQSNSIEGCSWKAYGGYVFNLRTINALRFTGGNMMVFLMDRSVRIPVTESDAQKISTAYISCMK